MYIYTRYIYIEIERQNDKTDRKELQQRIPRKKLRSDGKRTDTQSDRQGRQRDQTDRQTDTVRQT